MKITKHIAHVIFFAGSLLLAQQRTTPGPPKKSPAKRPVPVTKLLTVEDVENADGGNKVAVTQRDQSLTFTTKKTLAGTAAGFPVIGLTLLPTSVDWSSWSASFTERHVAIGDDGRENRPNLAIVFHKENQIVMLQGYVDVSTNKPFISMDRMEELARVICVAFVATSSAIRWACGAR